MLPSSLVYRCVNMTCQGHFCFCVDNNMCVYKCARADSTYYCWAGVNREWFIAHDGEAIFSPLIGIANMYL